MGKSVKYLLLALRLAMGWLLFYSGISKIVDSAWTAAPFLLNAKTFAGFYQALASPDILPAINFLNEWGQALLGASLILGIFVRFSGVTAAVLMMLYYFPVLDFPNIGLNSFIVDEHIIYAAVFLLLSAARAGRFWGLDSRWRRYR